MTTMNRKQAAEIQGLICQLEDRESPTSLAAVGDTGINSLGLNRTGAGVRIGQVELGRPGKNGIEPAEFVHNKVNPGAVYDANAAGGKNEIAVMGFDLSSHATQVASIMVAQAFGPNPADRGVASQADLRSSAAFFNEAYLRDVQAKTAAFLAVFGVGAQVLANKAAGDYLKPIYAGKSIEQVASDQVAVMNLSFGDDFRVQAIDGSAQTALILDYFITKYDCFPVRP